MMFFYFSLFKYLFLILGSPVFAYLSEKTESIMEGKGIYVRSACFFSRHQPWNQTRFPEFFLANCIYHFYPAFIINSIVGSISPVISGLVECYFYGFSMLDYSCERHNLSPSESIQFIGQRRGLAIGNGLVFYLMHFIPFVGWVLAPSYALIAATISLYHQNIDS